MSAQAWDRLVRRIVTCRRCPRLVAYRTEVARKRRRAFEDWTYWGRPVPGFGDRRARCVLVGLAPAAHGANRTGRIFTGDRSGDFLFAALHRLGLANQATSVSRDDGLELRDVFVTAVCRCAPPQNRPAPDELERCRPFLAEELRLLPRVRVAVALGAVAWDGLLKLARAADPEAVPRPRPRFGHGARIRLPLLEGRREVWVVGSYHPSQQNTQTGRLTEEMFDAVLREAADLAGIRIGPTTQLRRRSRRQKRQC